VVVHTAVWTREPRRTDTLLLPRITVAVVAAIIRADFDITGDAAVTNTAITSPLEAGTMSPTAIRTFTDTAVWSRKARLAQARSIVTVPVDTLRTKLSGAIRTSPSRFAVTDSIDALSAIAALRGALLMGTLLPEESRQAVARAIVTVAVTGAVGRTG